jgi:hypothetical protein
MHIYTGGKTLCRWRSVHPHIKTAIRLSALLSNYRLSVHFALKHDSTTVTMTANYEDWLFQPFEIDYSEPFDEKDPRVQRDVARFYYQGYSETDIFDSMKIKNVKMLLDSCDNALRNFLQTVHDRNRALRVWVFDDDDRAPEACSQEVRKEMTRRNVLRHYLAGDKPDLIELLIPDAGDIFARQKTDSPALWDFIDRRNRALNQTPPTHFEMDEREEVFVWNLRGWTIEGFDAFVNRDRPYIENRLDALRKATNSQGVCKYEVFEATEKRQSTWGDDEAVRRASDRERSGFPARLSLTTWI